MTLFVPWSCWPFHFLLWYQWSWLKCVDTYIHISLCSNKKDSSVNSHSTGSDRAHRTSKHSKSLKQEPDQSELDIDLGTRSLPSPLNRLSFGGSWFIHYFITLHIFVRFTGAWTSQIFKMKFVPYRKISCRCFVVAAELNLYSPADWSESSENQNWAARQLDYVIECRWTSYWPGEPTLKKLGEDH